MRPALSRFAYRLSQATLVWILCCAQRLPAQETFTELGPSVLVEKGFADSQYESHGPSVLVPGSLEATLPRIDLHRASEADQFIRSTSPLRQAAMWQPTPLVYPRAELTPVSPPPTLQPATTTLTNQLFDSPALDRSVLRQVRADADTLGIDYVRGEESKTLSTTDIGSLLQKSPSALSSGVQRRTPIVNDPRIRSSRIGALAAAGSYWVPARADLDTVLSKVDSRLIEDVIIVPGPYSSVHGPGFRHVDFQLRQSPRSNGGLQWSGGTSFEHGSNGNQWLGQQSISAAAENWGAQASYTHRLGSDYRAGNGQRVASSYESRELALSYGRDLGNDRSIEFSLLRLDQTDVEFPGYVFDIDVLVTDAYEVAYINEDPYLSDRSETEVWYNRTWFEGESGSPAKRAQFPLLSALRYTGSTDVDALSTGYRRALTWKEDIGFRFTFGHDLRFIKQELNEVSSGVSFGRPIPFVDRNSPIPRSFSANPGLFFEYQEDFMSDEYTFRTGGRVDFVQTDIVGDESELAQVGLEANPASYNEIVGTDVKQTDRFLYSLYGTLEHRFNESLIGTASLGYAERAPTLTELYAAQPFLLLLQNGLNNVTGDPTLEKEKLIQFDVSTDYDGDIVRAGVRGFCGWSIDYITMENTDVGIQQVDLRYVNTDLATLAGGEAFLELLPDSLIAPFVYFKAMDGRDRTRNGDFATSNGQAGSASLRNFQESRGFFSRIVGSDSEPLPGINPTEVRVGTRINDQSRSPEWTLVISGRIVDNQDRVATSLLESPTPGFAVWDIRGTYQPTEADGLVIAAGVENLFDKTYREHLDFRTPSGVSILQPGTNIYIGADWTY